MHYFYLIAKMIILLAIVSVFYMSEVGKETTKSAHIYCSTFA